jgi:hypothetical protein
MKSQKLYKEMDHVENRDHRDRADSLRRDGRYGCTG